MALREFTDYEGTTWRVWDITPETVHPATRIEDYLQGFIDGWLVFETASGTEKRRLYPLPARWETASVEELEGLCRDAEPVRPLPDRNVFADRPHEPERRTFSYPGGREWTVAETPVQYRYSSGRPAETMTVLRFSSGSRNLDLLVWPRDWAHRSETELAELLWRAFPRDPEIATLSTEARRRGEQSGSVR